MQTVKIKGTQSAEKPNFLVWPQKEKKIMYQKQLLFNLRLKYLYFGGRGNDKVCT